MCGGRGDAVDDIEGLPVYMVVCLPLYIYVMQDCQ